MKTALENQSIYADSLWKRQIAKERLTIELINKRDTTQAGTALAAMTGSLNPDWMRKRALLRLVYMHYCVKDDYAAAYGYYQTLENLYPRTNEHVYAKVLLKMIPDSTERPGIPKISEDAEAESGVPPIPDWISLEGPYPNPFNPKTSFVIKITDATDLSLLIYSEDGKIISVLASRQYSPGIHEFIFDAADLPSGLYLYRLIARNTVRKETNTKEGKAILIK